MDTVLVACPFCAYTNQLKLDHRKKVVNNEFTGEWVQVVKCAECGTEYIELVTWQHRPIENMLREQLMKCQTRLTLVEMAFYKACYSYPDLEKLLEEK
jgi:hypothetical protein